MGYTDESYYCEEFAHGEGKPWITEQGWYSMLRHYIAASSMPEDGETSWNVLWLYVPDY